MSKELRNMAQDGEDMPPGAHGGPMRRQWDLMGHPWDPMAPPWRPMGVPRDTRGAPMGCPGRPLGRPWGPVGSYEARWSPTVPRGALGPLPMRWMGTLS